VKHILAGIFLGFTNYIAVYALLKVLALQGWESSQLFPIYSVGVVAVSAVLALLFFKERLSRQKTVGLVTGLVAAAVGMMWAAAWLLVRPQFRAPTWLRTTALVAGAFVALLKWSISPLQVLAATWLIGFFWMSGEDP
jgi:chromate transport protein ChrA